ncbi:MAG: biotin--[acetyl-CoA-carboxylase] ligase [Pseudolysinimonas sp.]|uniref:biotin--[acetyl-CoA-carboxylase] ligase n=1 Tax=Pseudolysinimonas sp. TaxID=2680009 RepID=UPI0032647759
MEFPLSVRAVPELRILGSTPSTNSALMALAADAEIPSFSTIVTLDQTAGRGRLDRSWVAPPGLALASSVLVRDALRHPLAGWLPLLAGLALTDSLAAVWPGRFGLKWPNDVLLGELKVCGVLVEVVPGSMDAVVGAGLNLAQTADQLPVPTATSLAAAGLDHGPEVVDGILAGYLTGLRDLLDEPPAAGVVRDRIAARCLTIGRRVRVELAAGDVLVGTATGLDATGRLEVLAAHGTRHTVSVGDVTHVRPA